MRRGDSLLDEPHEARHGRIHEILPLPHNLLNMFLRLIKMTAAAFLVGVVEFLVRHEARAGDNIVPFTTDARHVKYQI